MSRTKRTAFLAILLLTTVSAVAQPVRVVVPAQESGAVVSTAVTLPASFAADADTLAFTVVAGEGVRLLGASSGRVAAGTQDLRIPLTLALSRQHQAGRVTLATVRVTHPAGQVWEAIVETDVRARRRLDVVLVAEPPTIAPGGRTRLYARFRNSGNAPDTLALAWETSGGWQLRSPAHTIIVPAGAQAETSVLVEADQQARAGDARTINLLATGRSGALRGTSVVQVFAYGGIGQEMVQMPATVFVGTGASVTGAVGIVGAVNVSAEPFRDTRVQLTARQNSTGVWSPAFMHDLAGPRAQLSVARPTWTATAGDVGLSGTGLLGSSLHGRGLMTDVTRGSTQATGFAAATHGTALRAALRQGYLQTTTKTRYGRIGATAVGLWRGADVFGQGTSVQALGVRYALPASPAHRLRVEAGLMRVRGDGSAPVLGPMLDADYSFTHERAAVSARLRHVPTSLPTGEILPGEASVNAQARLSRAFGVQGWALSSRLVMPGAYTLRNEAAAVGASWMQGRMRADVTGQVRRNLSTGPAEVSTHRESVSFTAGVPVGALNVDASAEIGRNTLGGETRLLRVVRGGVRYTSPRGFVTAGVSRHEGESSLPHVFASLSGSLVLARAELNMGAMAAVQGREASGRNIGGWLSASVPVGARLVLVAGLEADPSTDQAPVRISAGLRHRLSVPLPLKPPAAAHGLVFEDANGNGRQDTGEAGVPGATVRVGSLRAITDAAGRWTLQNPEAAGQTVTLDATTLPAGVLPLAPRTSGGRTLLPVIQGATLTIALYVDENASGAREAGEPVATRVSAALRSVEGGIRYADVDAAGAARFTGVLPGVYTLVLQRAGAQAPPPRTVPITLEAGQSLTLDAAAPAAERAIRFSTRN